ncbi:MAG: NLP/P60 protein [uncultured bacterium]|nr:MAG: NLP/P60 protein [uncultured bacterium]HLD45834.1 NlpC/P60 family protein [bacterium]
MPGFNLVDDLGFLLADYYSIDDAGQSFLDEVHTAHSLLEEVRIILENDQTGLMDQTFDSYEDFYNAWDQFVSRQEQGSIFRSARHTEEDTGMAGALDEAGDAEVMFPPWFAKVKKFFTDVEAKRFQNEDTIYQVRDTGFAQSRLIYIDVYDEAQSIFDVLFTVDQGINELLGVYAEMAPATSLQTLPEGYEPADRKEVIMLCDRLKLDYQVVEEMWADIVAEGITTADEVLDELKARAVAFAQDRVVSFACKLVSLMKGKKYTPGGKSPRQGFDCSGLVWYVYKSLGLDYTFLGANSFSQSARDPTGAFAKVTDDVRLGDVVWFPGHVGVVTSVANGRVQFVHSCSRGVVTDDLEEYIKYSPEGGKHFFYRNRALF